MQRATPLYSEYMTSEEDFPGFSFFFFVSSGRLSEINKHEDVDVVFFLSFFPQRQNRPGSYHHKRKGGDKSGLGRQTRHRLCTFREKRKTSPSIFFPLVVPPDSFFFFVSEEYYGVAIKGVVERTMHSQRVLHTKDEGLDQVGTCIKGKCFNIFIQWLLACARV